MNQKSILHIITGLNRGGAEKSLFSLTTTLQNETNLQHLVLSLTTGGTLEQKFNDSGILTFSLGLNKLRFIHAYKTLQYILQNKQPVIIQGWMYHGNIISSLVKYIFNCKIPIVWNIRHSLYNIKHEKYFTRVVIKICSMISINTDAIIYNSKKSASLHEKYGYKKNKTVVINNGFIIPNIANKLKEQKKFRVMYNISKNNKIIGMVGNYRSFKDYPTCIKAFSKIKINFPDVTFVLVGIQISKENDELMRLIKLYQIEKDILLLGEIKETANIIKSFDIFMLSSMSESFPNVIAEAMSLSIPVVATDTGDVKRIVENTGLVVESRNPDSLGNACIKLLKYDSAKLSSLGNKARHRIQTNYSLAQMTIKYNELYSSLI